jgi:CRISPR-associated protein Cas1
MIIRAATARAIVASGLHPSLSIHHVSRGSALRLADDLMEPFRPYADLRVRTLAFSGHTELTPDTKRSLAAILTVDLHGSYGASPLQTGIDRLATSLGQVYCKERKNLELPGEALTLHALSR